MSPQGNFDGEKKENQKRKPLVEVTAEQQPPLPLTMGKADLPIAGRIP